MANLVQRNNLIVKGDLTKVTRRDFPLATPAHANPFNAAALVDGEWMYINGSGKIARACDITQAAGTVGAQARSYVLWAERGRTDVQASSSKKAPVLFSGDMEMYTRIYDSALGSTITAPGQSLKVAVVELTDTDGNTRKYSGLMRHAGTGDNDPVVGFVTEIPSAANGYKLKFQLGGRTVG